MIILIYQVPVKHIGQSKSKFREASLYFCVICLNSQFWNLTDGGTGCALVPLRNERLEYQPALVLQGLEPVFERKPVHHVSYGVLLAHAQKQLGLNRTYTLHY